MATGRRTVKGVAGYDLTKLFVGSEGTLGVITQATLALRPQADRPHTMAAVFDSPVAAARAVTAIMGGGHVPSLLEVMDATCIRVVNEWKRMDLPADAGAMLLAQSDNGSAAVAEIAKIGSLCGAAGATEVAVTSDPAEGEMLLEARRVALLALERLGTTMIDDVCVPPTRFADLFEGVEKHTQLRRPVTPSGTNLLGLVKHLGSVEYDWFRETFGRESQAVRYDPDARDADMRAEPHETTADIVAYYSRAAMPATWTSCVSSSTAAPVPTRTADAPGTADVRPGPATHVLHRDLSRSVPGGSCRSPRPGRFVTHSGRSPSR